MCPSTRDYAIGSGARDGRKMWDAFTLLSGQELPAFSDRTFPRPEIPRLKLGEFLHIFHGTLRVGISHTGRSAIGGRKNPIAAIHSDGRKVRRSGWDQRSRYFNRLRQIADLFER